VHSLHTNELVVFNMMVCLIGDPEAWHHVESDTASARKTTANIGGKGTWAADFMPRTPASPKHSSPGGADCPAQVVSMRASVFVSVLHVYVHFRRTVFLNQLKSKCGLLLGKAAALRVTLNLDGSPITSNSHTHPSHSQTSRLLTSSLSLGVPGPKPTQCMRDV
jgi:hypothetical protein